MTNLQAQGSTTVPSVSVGPSGRAMAQPMEPALLEGLLQHLTMERRASAFYFANSLWLANVNYVASLAFSSKNLSQKQPMQPASLII